MGETRIRGSVVRKFKHFYEVETGTETLLCRLSSKLRKDLEYPEAHPSSRRRRVQAVRPIAAVDPVVVGDEVIVERGREESLIVERLPRRTTVSRQSPGRRHLEQVIAANVDQVLIVTAPDEPPFREDLLDRFLCGAEFQELPSVICVNKIDLGVRRDVAQLLDAYPPLGYQVIKTSARTGEGITALGAALCGKVSLALGLSGVGKTSLINALVPGLNLRVDSVNKRTGLGKHTTTTLSLIRLPSGGSIVDAPGIRELGLWGADEEDIPLLFPEVRAMTGTCRFGGRCTHIEEPGCVVREAVEAGRMAEHRYASYVRIRGEIKAREPRYE